MSAEKNFLALLYLGTRQRNAGYASAHSRRSDAHPGSLRSVSHHLVADAAKRSAKKTRNLISVLLAHGTRATRSSRPRAKIAMNVFLPDGRKAVRIKMAR